MTVKMERLNHLIEVDGDQVEAYEKQGWEVVIKATKKLNKPKVKSDGQ